MEFGMQNNYNPQGTMNSGVDWYTPSAYGAAAANYRSTSETMGSMRQGNSFEDEPPLLEELGIDLGGILQKTQAVLLHRLNNRVLEDLDMGGALVFVIVLAGLHLLSGKLHFGVILGWSVVHSAVLWFIVNQMAGAESSESKGLDLYNVCCLVGYCMVPLVVYSAITLLIPRGALAFGLLAICVLWSAHTAAKIFVRKTPALEGMQSLLMLPCLLLYSAFAMLCIY